MSRVASWDVPGKDGVYKLLVGEFLQWRRIEMKYFCSVSVKSDIWLKKIKT